MVKVEFLGPIQKDGIKLDVTSLAELKEELNRDKSMEKWLSYSAVALNDEIITDIDTNNRAKYFEQAENGMWVRMALLKMINDFVYEK